MPNSVKENKLSFNTLFLTVAYTLQKVISFGYFIYYARFIGYVGTGKFVFAVSFATVFGILVDLGLSPVLIREVARVKEKAEDYLSAVFTVKIFFALIALLSIFICINLLDYPAETKNLVYFAAVVMVFESFTLTFYGIFRGLQNLKYEAIGTIIYQLLVLAAGFIGFQITHQSIVLGIAIFIGALGNLAYALANLWRKTPARPRFKLDFAVIRHLLKIAMPFFLAGIFIKIYAYVDILLLSFLKRGDNGDQYVGWYSVAYKLTYAIQFIPLALNNSIYPALSSFYTKSKELMAQTIENAFRYLIIISLPISLGAFVYADKITVIFTKQYANTIPAFRVSILGLIFIFLNFILSSVLNASNKQTINTLNIGLTVVLNVLLNILLIPHYNHVGASISALASAIFLFINGMYWTNRLVKLNRLSLLKWFLKSALATVMMISVTYYFRNSLKFFYLAPLGAVIYVIFLFLVKAISRKDILSFYHSIIRR
ncbi:MAG: flippase [Patescibacteria group bacterium]